MGLLDKLRHKKNRSTSETHSPTSPSSPNLSNPTSPTGGPPLDESPTPSPSRVRQSLDERLDRSGQSIGRRSMDGTRPIVPVPSSFKPRSSVNLPSPSSGRSANLPPVPPMPSVAAHEDRRVHSPPFRDEVDRPDLPTTTSNVNNPVPGNDFAFNQSKKLPSLPHISAGPPLGYDLPPGAAPPNNHSHDLPPLPHVTSVNRAPLLDEQTHRPQPVIAESAQQNGIQGKFPHVQDLPVTSRASRNSTDSNYSDDIPARSTSLHPERARDLATSASTNQPPIDPSARYDAFRTVIDPDLTPEDFIAQYLHRTHLHTQQKPVVPKEVYGPFTTPALERERQEMVRRIAGEAHGRLGGERGLNEFGVDVFRRSGLGEKVGLGSTVDVHTKWLEPVVQEHIRIIEVHEYCTIIYQDVHKYDIYPKIQPIFDPEPIILEPRHRIYSPYDNEWHEVIGDAAAIAILGEDVFYNGQKTVREVRKSVLPGFEKENGEVEEGGVGRGLGRVREREGLLGGKWGAWRDVNRGRVFEGMRSPVPEVLRGFTDRSENHIRKSQIGLAV